MIDHSHDIRIPMQEQVTVTGTGEHYSPTIALPEGLWLAIDAWQNIKDPDEARRAGANIQEKIDEYCKS